MKLQCKLNKIKHLACFLDFILFWLWLADNGPNYVNSIWANSAQIIIIISAMQQIGSQAIRQQQQQQKQQLEKKKSRQIQTRMRNWAQKIGRKVIAISLPPCGLISLHSLHICLVINA